jgi:hypothetical protein
MLSMLSGRTAKYVEAMIREGDDFDYRKWLRRVQQEEAGFKTVAAPAEPVTLKSGHRPIAAQVPNALGNLGTAGNDNRAQAPREVIPRSVPRANTETPKKSIRQRLVEVCNVWEEFQETRDRDAVYRYLRAVFSIVRHYSWRRRSKKLVRRALQFAGLPVDMNADPFAVVIRCSCEHKLDNKTISKWSRALRYAAKFKTPRVPLKTFIKKRGGINGCTELFAKELGRHSRSSRKK